MESKAFVPYDASLSIQVTADASSYGLGAVFSDVIKHGSIRPVMYASRPLGLGGKWTEQNRSIQHRVDCCLFEYHNTPHTGYHG